MVKKAARSKSMSLVEIARATKPKVANRRMATTDETDLALAWIKDEINDMQVAAALKMTVQSAKSKLAIILKSAARLGYIKFARSDKQWL